MPVRRRLALAAAALLVAIAAGCHKSASSAGPEVVPGAPAGDVTEAAGPVSAIRAGAERTLAVGDTVAGDDTIVTGDGGRVTVVLRHNHVAWSLGPDKRPKVADSAAWGAPAAAGVAVATDEHSGAAGRHAEHEAADTRASETAPAPTAVPSEQAAKGAAPPPGEAARGDDDQDGVVAREVGDEGRMGKREGGHDRRYATKGPPHHASHGGAGGHDHDVDDTLDPFGGKDKVVALQHADQESSGTPGPTAIARVVDRHRAEIRTCYDHLGKQASGKLVVTFGVSPTGVVAKVDVQAPAALEAMRACVRDVFSKLRFPAGEKPWTATFPLIFNH